MANNAKAPAKPAVEDDDYDEEYAEELERENAELKAENARLKEQLPEQDPSTPVRPRFGLSEGTREELERTGKAIDPFTGARLVGTGKPGDTPREVSAQEFIKAKPVSGK